MLLFLELAKEEHVTKYKEVDKAWKELLDTIAILSQRTLPRSLFPDQRLKYILTQVDKMVKKNYPDRVTFDSDLPSVYKRFQTATLVTL